MEQQTPIALPCLVEREVSSAEDAPCGMWCERFGDHLPINVRASGAWWLTSHLAVIDSPRDINDLHICRVGLVVFPFCVHWIPPRSSCSQRQEGGFKMIDVSTKADLLGGCKLVAECKAQRQELVP